jgi:hypothetical protein
LPPGGTCRLGICYYWHFDGVTRARARNYIFVTVVSDRQPEVETTDLVPIIGVNRGENYVFRHGAAVRAKRTFASCGTDNPVGAFALGPASHRFP